MNHASETQRARKRLVFGLLAVAFAAASSSIASSAAPAASASPSAAAEPERTSPAPRQRALEARPTKYTGDFDVLLKHRMIRFLVPYSPTLFYHDHGRARGLIAQASAELEKYLNKKYPDRRPFTVVLIPTTRDRLLQGLVDGEGDVAGGSLTITPERLTKYDFTTPTYNHVNQIFVTGPDAPELRSLNDLAGKTVHVRRSKSFYQHLLELNQRFENPDPPQHPLPPMKLVLLPDELESRDVLDMVNVGLVQIAVCEDWLVDIWSRYLPNVRVRKDLVLREATQLGWAMRPQSPKLKAVLDGFIASGRAKGLFQTLLGEAATSARRMHNATGAGEMKRFEATISLFRKYGQQYQFDYLMLAAQGYQESRSTRTRRATSERSEMPATGAEMKVGDIHQAEPNIHAGTKYMAHLMESYFKDAKFDEQNRNLFAFASYNAGPGNIAKVRRRAMKEGVNPDVWFNEVEHVAARMLGQEPVRYVRNVFKYYVAYKLSQQTEAERVQAIEQLKSEPKKEVDDDDDAGG